MFTYMDKEFKRFLMKQIAKNTISVFNDEDGSDYMIPTPEVEAFIMDPKKPLSTFDDLDIVEESEFIISCRHTSIGPIPFGIYTLEYGDTTLETASAPLFSEPTNQKARDLISLARACSKKIIAQQKMAQKLNMIISTNNKMYAS